MSGEDRRPGPGHLFDGRYRLSSVLGRGAMADVWRADDEVLGRSVAVKIFRDDQPTGTDRRIDAEKRTLASLSHPGLVTLYDAGTVSDPDGTVTPYLVMELVDGPTLRSLLATRSLSPSEVARIGQELADALAYIHARGVVHRDIKPANILVAGSVQPETGPTVKLTDFGIARIVDGDRLTEHGTTVGTAHYLSPEQATGAPTGPASDIYALGLVLLELRTGRMAFEGSAVAAAVARLHRDPAVPDELGPGWVSLLTDMTSRRPEDRPSAAALTPRMGALVRNGDTPARTVALGGLRGDAPLDSVAVPTVAEPRVAEAQISDGRVAGRIGTERRSPTWVKVGGSAAAAIVAVIVGWSLLGPADNTVPEEQPSPSAPAVTTVAPVDIPAAVEPSTTAIEPSPPAQVEAPAVTPVYSPPPIAVQTGGVDPGSGAGSPTVNNGNSGNGNSGNGNSGNGNGNGNSGNGNSGNGNSGNGNGNSGNGNGNGRNGN